VLQISHWKNKTFFKYLYNELWNELVTNWKVWKKNGFSLGEKHIWKKTSLYLILKCHSSSWLTRWIDLFFPNQLQVHILNETDPSKVLGYSSPELTYQAGSDLITLIAIMLKPKIVSILGSGGYTRFNSFRSGGHTKYNWIEINLMRLIFYLIQPWKS
jgi:hypothetical protein